MPFDWLYFVVSFGGGIFGAAFGAMPVFILCGIGVVVGAVVFQATGDASLTNMVAFGPVLGPQVSFVGGVAAAVYAARRGKLASGRDIITAPMGLNSPDVLLVGGIFGMLGYIVWWAALHFNIGDQVWTNPVALSVVVNAILARVVFGRTGVFGKVRKGDNRWLPSEVANWVPWQERPMQLLVLGVGFGLVVAWSTVQFPKLAGLWFGVSALSLIFLQYGTKVPVTHHITLAIEQAVALGGDIWWGVAMGVLATFLGEFYACLFTAHGDSHIDPSASSLATTFTITAILRASGVLSANAGARSLIIATLIILAASGIMVALKSRGKTAMLTPSAAQ